MALKKFRKVGDLTLERKPEVIVEAKSDGKSPEEDGSQKPEDEPKDD